MPRGILEWLTQLQPSNFPAIDRSGNFWNRARNLCALAKRDRNSARRFDNHRRKITYLRPNICRERTEKKKPCFFEMLLVTHGSSARRPESLVTQEAA